MKQIITVFLCLLISSLAYSQEICDNGIDDDNDGLIDLNDSIDCTCEGFASTQTVPSLIPNSSFENFSNCPTTFGQLDRADTWIQASNATSDYYNCGFSNIPGFAAPPNPLPDGSGYVGFYNGNGAGAEANYKEYVGACLLMPMVAGNTYRLEFNMAHATGNLSTDISIFGSTDCANLPFGGNDRLFGCPTNGPGWTELDATSVTFSNSWEIVTLEFTPTTNINAVVIGGDCNPVAGPTSYYYADNLVLAEISGFGSASIIKDGNFCSNNLTLEATSDTTGTWQWYKEGIALVGETNSLLNISSNNLGTGMYSARITNGNKCEISDYILDTNFIASFTSTGTQICSNLDTGKIEVRNIIGTGINSPFEYYIDGNGPFSDSTFNNLTPGNYQIVVRDSNTCSDTTNTTVTGLAIPTADFRFDTVCIGDQTNFVDFSFVAIGSTITTMEWLIDGNTLNGRTVNYSYPTEGPHNVRYVVTSNTGCSDTITKAVVLEPNPTASFTFTDDCSGTEIDFTNQTTVRGINNPKGYTYNWDFGDLSGAITSSNNPNTSHIYTTDGTFNVTLQSVSARGCSDDTIIPITIFPLPVADFDLNDTCFGIQTNLTNTSIVSSGNITTNNWTFDNTSFSTQNVSHVASTDGILDAKLVVTTNNGCLDSVTKQVEVYSLPLASFSYTPIKPDAYNRNICFDNNSINAISYNWDFGFNNQLSIADNPCTTFPEIIDSGFVTVLIATSPENCKDTTFQTIFIDEVYSLHIANAFTPDGDNINDIFKPAHTGIQSIEFTIFDRWGEKLFETNQLNRGWDGTYKNVQSKQDVYVYQLIAVDIFNKKHTKTGHFTLIR